MSSRANTGVRRAYHQLRQWARRAVPFHWRWRIVQSLGGYSRPSTGWLPAFASGSFTDPGAPATGLGRAVIVIVSYNNLDYQRHCLDSLWGWTGYDDFRVVVVDNGSELEVVRYLRAAADSESRLQVIYNQANLGFARANNLGIEAAADCDCVVLLNNDTVVTPGWLPALLRHLQDPAIGLVGPVTNSAGNEARIDVAYRTLLELRDLAVRRAGQYGGQVFDIPVLAMYCVALRRTVLEEIGRLDEQFGVGLFEDDDYAERVRRAGYRGVCAEDVFVHHWGGASFSSLPVAEYERLFAENRRKFEKKWGRKWRPHQGRP